MKILITGSAGFIGFYSATRFLKAGYQVVGIDNINNYYDVDLKYDRLSELGIDKSLVSEGNRVQSTCWGGFRFVKMDIVNKEELIDLFARENFDLVINLAAQAGVRYSIENPDIYIQSNVVGFFNLLEACRQYKITRVIYASSSSVYGLSEKEVLSVQDRTDNPISLYAASKKSNELMAHVYSHLFNIQTIGLRFFTVYGPWGRPDMAPFIFADAIFNNKKIKVFNHGNMMRDFTYIDDIVEGLFNISFRKFSENYMLFNIGNSSPVLLLEFIKCLEETVGKNSVKELCDLQPGDVVATWADVSELIKEADYRPRTKIEEGIPRFIEWYKKYFKIDI